MSLKDRLNRLTGETGTSPPSDLKQATLNGLRQKMDAVMTRRERLGFPQTHPSKNSPVPLERLVDGQEMETLQGKLFCSRNSLNAERFHGHKQIGDLAHVSMEAAAFLSSADVKGLSIEDGLFIDTETTGLSGGTGTFPFLIGLGWFGNSSFVTCQLFSRDFSEEPAMLDYLKKIASGRQFLVSFNGKAYDLNLLTTRFILNRFQDIFSGMPHIDLLHPSRRIYSQRLENAKLATLEAGVLGVKRENDIPGQEIPQRYFDWLRRRDGRLIEDIFRHNRVDIVSMASLLKHLTDLINGGHDIAYAHHADLLSVAKLHHDRGDLETARRLFEPLLDSNQPGITQNARRYLSLIHKKRNQWDDAVSIWRKMLADDPYDVFAAIEMAKWYEHHAREFGPAAQIVQRILDYKGSQLNEADRLAMVHRLRRLLDKAGSGTFSVHFD
ncbi:MAG: ribonuclease H-like domain-containing protein [Desulfobacteraceae bacterium]|nr:ribonuclease H-like domain-containing protein [Desulfobacteraceae bacterium]